MNSSLHFDSLCVKTAEQTLEPHPHMEPIFATTTFAYDSPEELMKLFAGEKEGYIYTRWKNPTNDMAAEKISALETWQIHENGKPLSVAGHTFSSGMGALSAMFLATLQPGDKIIVQHSLYGGTHELLTRVLQPLGIFPAFQDLKNLSAIESQLKNDSAIKMIYAETPSNPTNDCYDLAALAGLAIEFKKLFVVDNTFATPYLQQPFAFHADFVFHSTTKFLNGHGNATGGILLGRDKEFMKTKLFHTAKLLGASANAFESWLLLQGLKTFPLRMERHCSNAMTIAKFLSKHKKVSRVNYCGLPQHTDHDVAKKQMKNFGAMMSFEVAGGLNGGIDFLRNLKLCKMAVSLGTVDTLVQHPASMSHVGVEKSMREKAGITDGMIRMSVGLEHETDLIDDLDQSLNSIH
jgi:methionine-gamma-lyase